jgi:hypothetical protein
VFTAQYGLIPYIKQITLRLSKVKFHSDLLKESFGLFECCFCHGDPEFTFSCTSCLIYHQSSVYIVVSCDPGVSLAASPANIKQKDSAVRIVSAQCSSDRQ